MEVVLLLLADRRIDVDKSTKNKVTPFFMACLTGNRELVALLLGDKRIDVNEPEEAGYTPLQCCL